MLCACLLMKFQSNLRLVTEVTALLHGGERNTYPTDDLMVVMVGKVVISSFLLLQIRILLLISDIKKFSKPKKEKRVETKK